MTKADVIDRAREMESIRIYAQVLAMNNVPTDVEEQVSAAALYHEAKARLLAARRAYDTAMEAWVAAGCPED